MSREHVGGMKDRTTTLVESIRITGVSFSWKRVSGILQEKETMKVSVGWWNMKITELKYRRIVRIKLGYIIVALLLVGVVYVWRKDFGRVEPTVRFRNPNMPVQVMVQTLLRSLSGRVELAGPSLVIQSFKVKGEPILSDIRVAADLINNSTETLVGGECELQLFFGPSSEPVYTDTGRLEQPVKPIPPGGKHVIGFIVDNPGPFDRARIVGNGFKWEKTVPKPK